MVPGPVEGQGDVEHLGRLLGGARPPAAYYERIRERPGAFEFDPDNGWVRRGRAVSVSRAAARAMVADLGLARLVSQDAQLVVQGQVRLPVLLGLYANTDSATLVSFASRVTIEARLFGTDAAPPYTLTSYYGEISRDRMNLTGSVLDWKRVSQSDTYYEGAPGCNGFCSSSHVSGFITELVRLNDPEVDFGLFDNDGGDNVPNSGDDDGLVDGIVVFHPEVDGACKAVNTGATNNLWAHRGQVTVTTMDPSARAGFGNIRVRDYIIQGGQGGNGGCADGQPQAIGVVAHETGHLFGLPDLYDGSGNTEGIGHWGLMGSGNWNTASRPAHMEAWSRAQLGWIVEAVLAGDTSLSLSAVEVADTALVVPIAATDEYYLLENRQPIGSDSMIHGPGLLVWHVDSVRIRQRGNNVNNFLPHGLALVQADGLNHLGSTSGGNRGDAGDPYPGLTRNTRLTAGTTPSAVTNSGAPVGVAIDSIRLLTPGGSMAFRIRFGMPLLVATSGPGTVASTPSVPADTLLAPGTVVQLIATPDADGVFDTWRGDTTTTGVSLDLTMDRAWSVEAVFAAALVAAANDPPSAVMGASYSYSLSASGGTGAYVWTLLSGTLPLGVTLLENGRIAGIPEETGTFPITARVTSGTQALDVSTTLSVSAPQLTTAGILTALLGTGGALSADEARYLDLLGNRNGRYDVGDFRAFLDKTGGAVTAEVMAELLRKEGAR
jgi:M6 family metalloprotease-like protein